jgi:hypothetical protein
LLKGTSRPKKNMKVYLKILKLRQMLKLKLNSPQRLRKLSLVRFRWAKVLPSRIIPLSTSQLVR